MKYAGKEGLKARGLCRSFGLCISALLIMSGCNDSESPLSEPADVQVPGDTETQTGSAPVTQAVALNFQAMVGDEEARCGQTYSNVGTPSANWTPQDFRFFVHDLRLIDEAGNEVSVVLDEVPGWQYRGAALLDFENAEGACADGTPETRGVVSGSVPQGNYRGVVFRIGVPVALNHLDAATLPAPLGPDNPMWWGWLNGYMFTKIEGLVGSAPFFIHLGSTGCVDAQGMVPSDEGICARPNRPEVRFPTFDLQTNRVAFDVKAIVGGMNTSQNLGGPPGCMSNPLDPECAVVLPKLGVELDGSYAGTQPAFRSL